MSEFVAAYTYDEYMKKKILYDLLGMNQLEIFRLAMIEVKNQYSGFFGYEKGKYAKYERPSDDDSSSDP